MAAAALSGAPLLASQPSGVDPFVGLSETRREHFTAEGLPSVDLHFKLSAPNGSGADRVAAATIAALARFTDWFGPYPGLQLTIVDAPWRPAPIRSSYPGVIVIHTRWIMLATDASLEREIIGAVARQYWPAAPGSDAAFVEGLTLYSGTRAVHDVLSTRHFVARRFFGDFVPFTSRSLPLSPAAPDPRPRVRHFDELEMPAVAPWRFASADPHGEAQRVALALHTLERYLGWPALQQALAVFRERAAQGPFTRAAFEQVASEQRGHDLSWFFDTAFAPAARYDYAIDALTSTPAAGNQTSLFDTRVRLRRVGDAVFAGTGEPLEGRFAAAHSLPVTVRFADGDSVTDWWDGRAAEHELNYTSRSRAVSAIVDPDAMLLLDQDRRNNARVLERPVSRIGVRMGLHWLLWLQDLLLSYSALA